MIILQCDFDKYPPEQLQLVANQVRSNFEDEHVLIIPNDVNFISNLTDEQVEALKIIFEQELEERKKNDL